MKRRLFMATLLAGMVGFLSGCKRAQPSAELYIVREGRPTSAIILPKNAAQNVRAAVQDFAATVTRSTGAEIPILDEGREAELPVETARIFVGACAKADTEGLSSGELGAETWRMVTRGGNLFVIGRDEESSGLSMPTRWALNALLETGLGVRWLWPGELGTFVPRRATFTVSEMDRTHQPALILRSLALDLRDNAKPPLNAQEKVALQETRLWSANHQVGRRDGIQFGHAFEKWWEKYGKDHPEYFAQTWEGQPQPVDGRPDRVKLRLSNPEVLDRIVREYAEAGAPRYYSVCPNDSAGFDLSPETRAWDLPPNQSLEDIWRGNANLTARYIHFWNLLHARLKGINPEVVLATYAYSAYRYPPPAECPVTARMVVGIVHKYTDSAYQNWQAWADTGVKLVLRPNWWHMGAGAPQLPLAPVADFLHFAWRNGMAGIHMDGILGNWSTQGLNYYLVARLMTRPDLTREDILAEYTAAFGKGAPKIREYIAYWEKETELNAIPAPLATAHGEGSINPQGRYEELVRRRITHMNPVSGSYSALPELFSDERLQPAFRLLDEAEALIGDSNPEARQRVAFLRDGLRATQRTRDMMAAARQYRARPTPENLEALQGAIHSAETFRNALTPRHVLWGEAAIRYEMRYKIPMRPEFMNIPKPKDDGLL